MPYVFAVHPVHGNFTLDIPNPKWTKLEGPYFNKGWNYHRRQKAEKLLAEIKARGSVFTFPLGLNPIDIPISEFTSIEIRARP